MQKKLCVRKWSFSYITPDRRQLKALLIINKVGSKMAIENSVSNIYGSTFVDSINVFDCHLSGVYNISLVNLSPVFFRSLPASDGDSTGSLTKPLNLVILGSEGLASDFITETRVSIHAYSDHQSCST